MGKGIIDFAGDMKRTGARQIIAAAAAPLFFVVLTILYFFVMSAYVKEGIINGGEISCIKSSNKFDKYLISGTDSIKSASYIIDKMMREERTSQDIFEYMKTQTDCIINTVDKSFTGVYGYINGEYIDGSGWVPDADYVPTERPWYIAAAEMKGELALVEPYLDAQTHVVMMTLAMMLSDGKSVVALDISLDPVQAITEEIAKQSPDTQSIVISDIGMVVAHSDKEQLGLNYFEEKDTFGSVIAERVFSGEGSHFEAAYGGQHYIIYTVPIENNWQSVSVIESGNALAPLKILFAVTVIVLAVTVAIAGAVFMSIVRKGVAEEKLNLQLSTVADIYNTVHDLDVINDTFCRITSKDFNVTEAEGDSNEDMREKLYGVVGRLSSEMSRATILEFVDIDTLEERLAETSSITMEFMNHRNLWYRARFIVSARTASGKLSHVIFTTELIDKEKRDRDKLLYLSEIDRLTGISNRGSGENKIRVLMSKGEYGMFMLLDADKFKSINDTYGHAVGDKVLMSIAYSMKRTFRSVDVVMRLGGDEFAAYLPGVTDPEMGRKMTGRLFDCIEKINIPEMAGRSVFVSIGAAFYLEGESYSFDELYKHADSCTYISKRHNGNYAAFYGCEDNE